MVYLQYYRSILHIHNIITARVQFLSSQLKFCTPFGRKYMMFLTGGLNCLQAKCLNVICLREELASTVLSMLKLVSQLFHHNFAKQIMFGRTFAVFLMAAANFNMHGYNTIHRHTHDFCVPI